MTVGLNWYRADLRELSFVLLEQFRLGELLGKAPYEAWGPEEAKAVLEETYRFAREVLGPLNASGDRQGCRLEEGQVRTPDGFREAWKRLYESGFKTLGISAEHGGQGAPTSLQVLVEELLSGANPAFNMYPGLAFGAAETLLECATPEQAKRYAAKMLDGTWGGTMCLTEPHAGSDVGAAKTSARRLGQGRYAIRGTKVFISAGDHDLAENIIHLVLARVEGAPPGTKGLSLFIVPKKRIGADGSSGESNDVTVGSIEHKMGINGSATAVLNFGDNDRCIGELVGTVENVGMSQMFRMMNGARIAVGIQGLATAAAAYLNAVQYAHERKQGPHYTHWKDPTAPRVAIIEHADVRRMLMDLKSHTEGIRALIVKLAWHGDSARTLTGRDQEKTAYHRGQVDLLTPLVKSFASDEAFRLAAVAIQVYGGAGYLKDHPVEQYTRDAKIFSIYEGTNHIQAMDLVGRKMGQAGGAHFQAFLQDVAGFVEAHKADPTLGQAVELLASGQEALMSSAMTLLGWSQSENLGLIGLNASRVLTMMSQVAVGWMLLEAAAVAQKALAGGVSSDEEKAFYSGKIQSALWFARNVLPGVEAQARSLALEDDSALKVPDSALGTS
jgi:alkylation response protein AidB-like acyl-CoA dehydrogenase